MKTSIGKLGAALAIALMAGTIAVSAKEEAPAVSKPVQDITMADNTFGFDVLKKLHKEGENRFLSPTSIAVCVQMAGQAAAGDTRAEMDKAMGVTGLDAKAANKELLAELNKREGVKLKIANSLWADPERVALNDEYVKEVKEYFGSEARALDFDDPKSLDVINGWISEKTEKLINNMLDEIPPSAITYLVNAIYFKGDWTTPFKKEKTAEADFHLVNGDTSKVQMMQRKGDIAYYADNDVQVAKLPYGKDEQAAMWVVLPKEGKSLDDVVKGLDAEKLKAWHGAYERMGTIKLPRFKMKYKETLNDCLQSLGMKKAFTTDADFKRLGESKLGPIFIGRVLHEAVVIVNEEGTEAAAATVVEMRAGSARPPQPWEMNCDRPFLFMITDEPTGAIMFIGTCYAPSEAEAK